jgi:hypothetical protein
MPTVDYLTLAEARSDLAQRLGDPDLVFWRAAEIDEYLRESIQTWNVAALYHRTRASFNTTPGQAFYDISPLLSDGTSLVLERTLTPAQIITRIIYHLMENQGADVDGTAWVGTSMFTLDDLTQAVYRRVNRFLEETGQIVSRETQAVASGEGIIELTPEWIDVRRVAWTTPEGVTTNLWRTSEYVADNQFNDWNVAPGTPEAYSVAVRPIRTLQLIPPPIDNGTLDLLTVDTSIVTSVPIFNDFGWVIKWGAMADLLGQEGEANDPERSKYCEQRWAEGIQLAKIMSTVLRTMINGASVQTCALFDFDAQVPDWQDSVLDAATNAATPNTPAMAGPNLLALYPVPDVTLAVPEGNHAITMDVVRNAIIPTEDDDLVQIERQFLATILDYAQHLASFKCQGGEFMATYAHYERIFKAAAEQNSRLMENSDQFPILAEQEEKDRPRFKVAA